MNKYRTCLLDAIDAYRERHGMSLTRFGRTMMGDPTFVFRLKKGRDPRIDTVDRLLAEMGRKPIGPLFRGEVKAFLAVTGMKRSEFGRGVNKNRSFATWLLGGGLPRLGTMDKARALMAWHSSPAEREEIRAAVGGSLSWTQDVRTELEEIDMTEDSYMSTEDAARFLKLSPRTLQSYRGSGKGPPFSRLGNRARYLRSKVAEWAAEREARSTTEADEKAREESAAASPPDNDDRRKEDG